MMEKLRNERKEKAIDKIQQSIEKSDEKLLKVMDKRRR